MNREIKFRGKTNTGYWITGNLVYSQNIQPAIYFEVGKGKVKSFDWAYVNPETVGQFTGLIDKNGKELYFGDFVKLRNTSQIWEVVQDGFGVPVFIAENNTIMIDFMDYFGMYGRNDFEIIGNYYENTELLKS